MSNSSSFSLPPFETLFSNLTSKIAAIDRETAELTLAEARLTKEQDALNIETARLQAQDAHLRAEQGKLDDYRAQMEANQTRLAADRARIDALIYQLGHLEEGGTNACEICSICKENMTLLQATTRLECNHSFHFLCLQKWYNTKNNATCTNCRGLIQNEKLSFQVGDKLDVLDSFNTWYKGVIIAMSDTQLKIHYHNWDDKFDEWLDRTSTRIAPVYSHNESLTISSQIKWNNKYKGQVVSVSMDGNTLDIRLNDKRLVQVDRYSDDLGIDVHF